MPKNNCKAYNTGPERQKNQKSKFNCKLKKQGKIDVQWF